MELIKPPKAPRLPNATPTYVERAVNEILNILRLYYNQLDTVFSALLGRAGGRFLMFPHGAFSRDSDFEFSADSTANVIPQTVVDFANGMTLGASDGIHVEYSGIYNYQYSVQFVNTDSQAHNAWLWLRNGAGDITATSSKFDVPSSHGSSDGYLIGACNFYVELTAGDYVELWGATTKAKSGAVDGVYLEAYAASASPFSTPSVPSVVATLSFVSAIPA